MSEPLGITEEGLAVALDIKEHYRDRLPICLPGEEARILNKLNNILQLTGEEKQELLHEGFNVMKGLDALVTAKARTLLVKILCAIAYSDQVIHGSEVEFINRINARFGNLVSMKPPGAWHEYEEEVAEILQEEFS